MWLPKSILSSLFFNNLSTTISEKSKLANFYHVGTTKVVERILDD